jgi:hypothetical protein
MSTKQFSRYTLEQLKTSGILPSERMLKLERDIESRIEPVFLKSGKEVENARCLLVGDGKGLLYPRLEHERDWEFMRREAIPLVLSSEELEYVNKHCWDGYLENQEASRFAKAEKVTEWDGPVFVGDTFYHSLHDAIDVCSDDEDGLPAYVWTASPHEVISGLDVASVVENRLDDAGWEDMSLDDLRGVQELQAALDAFEKANAEVLSYFPDYSKVVVLQDEETTAAEAATP